MKQCPVCKNTYTDESLIFCLSDGTRLTGFYEAEKTQALPGAINPTEAHQGRVSIPVNAPTMETKIALPTMTAAPPTERKGCSPLMIAVILGLFGILTVAGIAIAYFALKDKLIVQNDTPTPTPTVSQTNSNSTEQELKDKLDKLQKQLDEQKKAANKSTPVIISTPPSQPTPPSSATTAQVNSPGDGFLAMRSGPSHKSGYQIMKIPHGATVNVYNCQGYTTIASKTGRWCQVSYSGYSGWAFDAWLIY